jgi:hypothetical protein
MAPQMTREAASNNVPGSWTKLEEFTNTILKLQSAVRVDLGIEPP